MYDLNDLIDPALHLSLIDADAISNQGQIVARSGDHAYLLTPVPEPGTLTLIVVAVFLLMAWIRRQNAAV